HGGLPACGAGTHRRRARRIARSAWTQVRSRVATRRRARQAREVVVPTRVVDWLLLARQAAMRQPDECPVAVDAELDLDRRRAGRHGRAADPAPGEDDAGVLDDLDELAFRDRAFR